MREQNALSVEVFLPSPRLCQGVTTTPFETVLIHPGGSRGKVSNSPRDGEHGLSGGRRKAGAGRAIEKEVPGKGGSS